MRKRRVYRYFNPLLAPWLPDSPEETVSDGDERLRVQLDGFDRRGSDESCHSPPPSPRSSRPTTEHSPIPLERLRSGMADDKDGRENQAQNEERRQRERAVAAELERGDESEPPVDEAELDDLEADLEAIAFPATGAEVVDAIGDREIESADGTYALEELIPDTEAETLEEPVDVRAQVVRPTIAATMKRILEASESLPNADSRGSQRGAYERTFEELRAIDAVDEDEGIAVIGDWILERIEEKGELPGSRAVRRQAAEYCRANGYEVRDDEWLGV